MERKKKMTYEEFFHKYDIKANEQQAAALQRVEGATLLLAVPGSGKTTVIISRTGYMVYCAGISPNKILTLTFSLAAAREMKERYSMKFGTEERIPHFSTIHSFCVTVIRYCQREYLLDIPELEPQNERIIRRAYQTLTHQFASDSIVKELSTVLTQVKNSMMDEDEIADLSKDINCLAEADTDLPAFLKAYEEDKASNNLMDFDDQLLMAYDMLRKYPEVLNYFQDRFTYIAVDEAQDTSKIQHAIIELLAKKHGNIFMVGDDDQSIYGFRGASPELLLQFGKTYENAKILYMETNYRSDTAIIRQADQFIQDNKLRYKKSIQASSKAEGKIESIVLFDMADQYDKLYTILKADYEAHSGTTAVLYRNNDSVIPLLDLLNQKGLPVRCYSESNVYFSNPVVADLIALLSFAVHGDSDSFLRIYYKLQLYLTKQQAQFAVEESARTGKPILMVLKEIPSLYKRNAQLDKTAAAFQRISKQAPQMAINTILEALNYQKYINEGSEFSQQKADILRLLARNSKTVPVFLERINEWKTYDKNTFHDSKSNITLSTMHSSKGLEYDKVIMLDVTDGILPSKSTIKEGGSAYEEDVRLFYVGATRAKHTLIFFEAKNLFGKKLTKSRFITRFYRTKAPSSKKIDIDYTITSPEINRFVQHEPDSKADSFTEGTHIRHTMFGLGTIISTSSNGVVTIKFDRGGTKKLLLKTCLESKIMHVV